MKMHDELSFEMISQFGQLMSHTPKVVRDANGNELLIHKLPKFAVDTFIATGELMLLENQS